MGRLLTLGVGKEFNPRRVRGLGLDLDPHRHTGLSSGGAVASAPDFSGNARNADQSTAEFRPTWVPNVRNGRAVYRFDGGNDHFLGNTAMLSLIRNLAGCTVVMAYTATLIGSVEIPFQAYTGASTARLYIHHEASAANALRVGGRRLDAAGAQNLDISSALTTDTWMINTVVADYANNDLFVYQNGALIGSTTSFLTAGTLEDTASTQVNIGGAGSFFAQMDLARMLVYQRALSAGELAYVHRGVGRSLAIGVA